MTLLIELTCRLCGHPYTPTPDDIRAGPECRTDASEKPGMDCHA